jgi:hypothetical protein
MHHGEPLQANNMEKLNHFLCLREKAHEAHLSLQSPVSGATLLMPESHATLLHVCTASHRQPVRQHCIWPPSLRAAQCTTHLAVVPTLNTAALVACLAPLHVAAVSAVCSTSCRRSPRHDEKLAPVRARLELSASYNQVIACESQALQSALRTRLI